MMRQASIPPELRTAFGPFVSPSATPNDSLLSLQIFVCTIALIAVALAAGVAERDQSTEELRLSEQRFRTIFEQAAVGAALIETATGRFLRINQRYCDIAGYSAEEMTAITFQAITHPDDLQEDLTNMRKLIAGEITEFTMEKRYRRKDGSAVWVSLTVSPTWHLGEKPKHHIAVVEDITHRKQMEAALRTMNQELEQRVAERTVQLEAVNAALLGEIGERQRAEELIRDSLRVKEVLLREIHHRVKNNLAVISSIFYLQSTYAKDEQTIKMFQESQDRVRSMALVHESLYRSGDLGAVNFGEYLLSLADHLMRTYRLPPAKVALRTDIENVTLSIDTAIPCGLILNELISNCLKHAFPQGAGEISLSLRGEPGGRCVLRVRDSGVGIPEDLDVREAGSLGMRLVRSLTAQISGTFEVRRGNPGTEAELTFPAADGQQRN